MRPPAIATTKAPMIPPQNRSGTRTAKCQSAIAIITQTRTAMSAVRARAPLAQPAVEAGVEVGDEAALVVPTIDRQRDLGALAVRRRAPDRRRLLPRAPANVWRPGCR